MYWEAKKSPNPSQLIESIRGFMCRRPNRQTNKQTDPGENSISSLEAGDYSGLSEQGGTKHHTISLAGGAVKILTNFYNFFSTKIAQLWLL